MRYLAMRLPKETYNEIIDDGHQNFAGLTNYLRSYVLISNVSSNSLDIEHAAQIKGDKRVKGI